MNNLNTLSAHADQPEGQNVNGLPLDVPTSQVLGSHMIEQQDTNLTPFSHEQHRLQLDHVLQLYNEQVRVSLQLEASLQDANLLNLLATDALIQKHEDIASLHIVSSNQLDDPGSGDEASSAERVAAKTTKIDLVCEVCTSGLARMLLLPCKHLCACKACEARLTACPICGAVKDDAIEAGFTEK